MVFLSIEFHKLCLKIATNTGKNFLQVVKDFPCKDSVAIFRDKDQMNMEMKDTVPAVSDIVDF